MTLSSWFRSLNINISGWHSYLILIHLLPYSLTTNSFNRDKDRSTSSAFMSSANTQLLYFDDL